MIKAAEEIQMQIEDANFDFEIIDAADWLDREPPKPDQIIKDFFDSGDKVAIIGSSKLRKSFFTLQMAISLATGNNFLNFVCEQKRTVLLIQMEIHKNHFHRRVKNLGAAMFIASDTLKKQLKIINARGLNFTADHIKAAARREHVDVVIIDPLYKLIDDENGANDLKPILKAFDEIAEQTGAAIIYVHHDPKGRPGDRDIRDRGAGSGVLGRDYDACITLTRHRDDEQAAVIETLLRNYKPRKPFVAEWNVDHYQMSNLPVIAQNSGNAATGNSKPVEDYIDEAMNLIKKPVYTLEFDSLLHDRLGLADKKVRTLRSILLREGLITQSNRVPKRGGGQFIGLPADIEQINQEMKQQKLNMKSSVVSVVADTKNQY